MAPNINTSISNNFTINQYAKTECLIVIAIGLVDFLKLYQSFDVVDPVNLSAVFETQNMSISYTCCLEYYAGSYVLTAHYSLIQFYLDESKRTRHFHFIHLSTLSTLSSLSTQSTMSTTHRISVLCTYVGLYVKSAH